jgi:UDP-glucuronate decarboxylase
MNDLTKSLVIEDINTIISSIENKFFLKNKRILITGGCGMLLTYTLFSLINLADNEKNIYLVVRDVNKAKKYLNRFYGELKINFIESDLSSPLDLDVDIVIHGAGYGNPGNFNKNSDLMYKANIFGTYNLLKLSKINPRLCFVFISSGAVYGEPDGKEVINEDFIGVIDQKLASSIYGETKKMGEQMCYQFYLNGEINLKILRPAHFYGPTVNLIGDSRIFSNFVLNILRDQDLVIKGDGLSKRSFGHIIDFSIGLLTVIANEKSGEAYNIGNDNSYMSINELAEHFLESYPGRKILRLLQAGESSNKILLSSKKIEKLGWKPIVNIKDGIRNTVNHYRVSGDYS